jgi:ribonuclease HII
MLCGVDEAGRGPVLGPMVVAALAIEEEGPLKQLGVKDSKKLTAARREEIFHRLRECCSIELVIVTHDQIDSNAVRSNLNELEAEAFALAIGRLQADQVFVDACDANEQHFHDMVMRRLGYRPNMTCCHRADDLYPVVGAASIAAKVTRDALVKGIADEIGQDVGSGYASDPVTIAFLKKWIKENGDLPPYTRRSWATAKEIVSMARVRRLSDWD